MSRPTRQPGIKQLGRQLVPDDMDVTDAVAEANRRAGEAIEDARRAVGEAHRARQEADQAPERDAQADLAAHREGKKLPKPTAPDAERKADTAERAARIAHQEAVNALDALHAAAIAEDRQALIASQEAKVNAAYEDAAAKLDATSAALLDFKRQVGRLRSLHEGKPEIDHWSGHRLDGGMSAALADLRSAAERMRDNAAPMRQRVLDLVGDGATWDEVAEGLGVSKIDSPACFARNELVNEGRLRYLDADGVPLEDRDRRSGQLVVGRRLVPGEPYETPSQRARRKRREREARAAA